MNNWRAIGYIFLGFGTVFLVLALCVFLGLISIFSGFSFFGQASIPISLAASAPWLILASIMYVVGIVGYFAGKEKHYPSPDLDEVGEEVSRWIDSYWSFPIGAFTTFVLLIMEYFTGIIDNSNIAFGVILPITISIVVGIIVGIVIYLMIYYLD